MRSKVAQRILDETPISIWQFVRRQTNTMVSTKDAVQKQHR
jgi:hypothetical protein